MSSIKLPPHLAYLRSDSDFSVLTDEDVRKLLLLFGEIYSEYETVVLRESKAINLAFLIHKLEEIKSQHENWADYVNFDCDSEINSESNIKIYFSKCLPREILEKKLKVCLLTYEIEKKQKLSSAEKTKNAEYEKYLVLKKKFEK